MNTFNLKLIGLICMLLDHIYNFFPNYFPIFFRWLGRGAAPIFTFCLVYGLRCTSNRKKYLLRLYLGSVIMSIGNFFLQNYFANAKIPIISNIFSTFFLIGVIIHILDNNTSKVKKIMYILCFIMVQVLSVVAMLQITKSLPELRMLCGIIPNIFICEGGWLWIIFGILIFLCNDSVKKVSFVCFIYGLFLFWVTLLIQGSYTLYSSQNCEWMLIIAIIPISLWNKSRGRKCKWMFYVFYPVHIWILFSLSSILS